jgi:hypothetical protein
MLMETSILPTHLGDDVTVWVVIPWRAGCPYREAAFDYVTRWWSRTYPDWPVVVGPWPAERFNAPSPAVPWRKGCAVRNAGVHPDPDDVVVVSDADVIPVGVGDAVDSVGPSGRGRLVARWAMPFRMVHRLTQAGTELVTSGRLGLPAGSLPSSMSGVVEESYVGSAGGGTVVLRGDVFNAVPIDPRFAGYGQEDLSWSLALHRLTGAPTMRSDPLWHLWHPPQERMRRGATVSRGVGSEDGLRLWQRYRQATTPATMQALIAEARREFKQLMGDVDVGAY